MVVVCCDRVGSNPLSNCGAFVGYACVCLTAYCVRVSLIAEMSWWRFDIKDFVGDWRCMYIICWAHA